MGIMDEDELLWSTDYRGNLKNKKKKKKRFVVEKSTLLTVYCSQKVFDLL